MLSNSLIVRSAVPADASAIVHTHILAWQQAYAALLPGPYLQALESSHCRRERFWEALITSQPENVRIACMSNEVIGFIAVDSTRDDHVIAGMTGEVVALYVLSAYWRTGIGRALWIAGLQSLVERGYRQAMLWVLSENARARQFYAKAGWSPEPSSERSRLIGGASLQEIRYRSPVLR